MKQNKKGNNIIKNPDEKKLTNRTKEKISPFLWFDNQAEQAANFYVMVFKNSKMGTVTRYSKEGAKIAGRPEGSAMTVSFELEGREFAAINGGPIFKFTPAISFFVGCKTAEEVDGLWEKLSVDGKILMALDKYPFSERYGWIQDKYGVTWQLFLGDYSQKITPLLMFAGGIRGKAEEAMNMYISLFKNSKITHLEKYSKEEGFEGTLKFASFNLSGQEFMAMDSHNDAKIQFNEAISLFVNCDTQKEIDYLWEKLSTGGEEGQCGWLKDRYGVSWQIVPTVLGKLLSNASPEKASRVMGAIFKMTKLDIDVLEQAYAL
jgi:predicted 3-demethylubiquinone-9 3-methyltransferase (glyoxalase superfamily)